MNSSDIYARIMREVQGTLMPLSFSKKGNSFVQKRNDVVLVVQLQKSVSSTSGKLLVTLNLGVYVPMLGEHLGRSPKAPSLMDCQWQVRIGHLMPDRRDKWWEASESASAEESATEIALALKEYGLPTLESVDSTEKLVSLWRSGRSPGATDYSRQQFLQVLSPES